LSLAGIRKIDMYEQANLRQNHTCSQRIQSAKIAH
jgi:hypothetical protein